MHSNSKREDWGHSEKILDQSKIEAQQGKFQIHSSISDIKRLRWLHSSNLGISHKIHLSLELVSLSVWSDPWQAHNTSGISNTFPFNSGYILKCHALVSQDLPYSLLSWRIPSATGWLASLSSSLKPQRENEIALHSCWYLGVNSWLL